MEYLEIWNTWVSGGVLPLALAAVGGYFTVRMRRVWLHPIALLRRMLRRGRGEGISPMRAMSLSLAGVLGVGNLVGVASAISYGGAGAIFWMWVSATLAMFLKYAEIVLALRHRRRRGGSLEGCAMYYIEDSFTSSPSPSHKRRREAGVSVGRALALGFAVLLLIDAFCMGGIIQVEAVSSAFSERLGIPRVWIGGLLAGLVFVVGMRGDRSVASLAQRLVPIMTLGFCVLSVAAIVCRAEMVPSVLQQIVRQGLTLDGESAGRGVLGGVGAFLMSRSLRYGTMRGLLSNEAGCGSSPMAHADAATDDPVAQGGMGMLEVFVDTHLLCSMTALVILLAFSGESLPDLSPMMVTVTAFERLLGRGAGIFLCAAVLCFGLATVLCWSHYAQRAGAYLLPAVGKARYFSRLRDGVFLFLYCAFVCVGAFGAPEMVWQISDFAIGGMTLINLGILLRCRREIIAAR
ncbi:MAG: amino acid carrier protein [Clostridia bacterium]|nr:amino acid carrier protein [Clostridia bacterium]